jgi:hypothetical protein
LDGKFSKFFNFDKMITPAIIKVLFWIGMAIVVVIGLSGVAAGIFTPYGGGRTALTGLLTLVVGPIVVRVYCELLIVIFKMHEALEKIANKE